MHLHEITAESLTRDLGVKVEPIYVIVAKNSVMGMDRGDICSILQCTDEELREVEAEDVYKAIRAEVASSYAEMTLSQTTGWDAIEATAVNSLMKRLPFEKDSEFLLKAAAVANKAVRRTGKDANVLDPTRNQGRTVITLSTRLVQRLNRPDGGQDVMEQTKTLSIHDNSMQNPSFDEVDSLLSVKNIPVLPRAVEISTRNADPDMDELMTEMNRRAK